MILWLESERATSGSRFRIMQYAKSLGLNDSDFLFRKLTRKGLYYRTKTIQEVKEETEEAFHLTMTRLLKKGDISLIVCQDPASLKIITGKYLSLSLCRGGVYSYKNIPVLVIDAAHKIHSVQAGKFIFLNDFKKVFRFYKNKKTPEPEFSYKVCRTKEDLLEFRSLISSALFISIDIETTGQFISCSGYTLLLPDNTLKSFVVPFIDPTKENCCFYEDAKTELLAWEICKEANQSTAPKVLQNGKYDSAYFIRYSIPLRNFIFDTMCMWHSLYCELPKSIDFISSILIDSYAYWKDSLKESSDDDSSASTRIPKTSEGLEKYWKYNAEDTYFTALCAMRLIEILLKQRNKPFLKNYLTEIRLTLGPCHTMEMTGTRFSTENQTALISKWATEQRLAEEDLEKMTWPGFNPNSSADVATLLHELLHITLPKRAPKRTTQKNFLKIVQQKDPLANRFISQIISVKEPKANISKYGKLNLINNRFFYSIGPKTVTERLASSSHAFHVGTNIQNIPREARPMLVPDPEFFIVDVDYAQSDAYYTAFVTEEEKFIDVLLSDKDTHCVHAAGFFKKDYKEVLALHKQNSDITDHPVTGIRQLTKKIIYGANYLMAENTFYIIMTRTSLIAAAKAVGFSDADSWSDSKLTLLGKSFLDAYHRQYPRIKEGLKEEIQKALRNNSTYTAPFGFTRKFFGDLTDKKTQGEFASFIGQGGTAGCINKAMLELHFSIRKEFPPNTFNLLFQVHDSLVFQVHRDFLWIIPKVLEITRQVCSVKGRTFSVPTEAVVGVEWNKKKLVPFIEDEPLEELKARVLAKA